jgi:hypothetical protein
VTADLPDGISSVDSPYLSRLRPLNLPASFLPNLTVVSDRTSPDGISSFDLLLQPYVVISVFKRIVPPYAGLLRPYAFKTAFLVLDGLFKESISMGRFTQGTT